MKTVDEVKKMWILAIGRSYTTTQAPKAWKAYVRDCKKRGITPDEAYEMLKATYEYNEAKNKEDVYSIRFWNRANENVKVGGRYTHTFDTEEDAWDAAYALASAAEKRGAVEMDMNNRFFDINRDDE